MTEERVLAALGLGESHSGVFHGAWAPGGGETARSVNPATDRTLCRIALADGDDYDRTAEAATEAFRKWSLIPAPARGEHIRRIGLALRARQEELSALITLETGKILAEGRGEVREMIDICDFAVGLSRQLYGLTMTSERPGHRMFEQWHPLGPAGVITAFNFPAAVWSWNAAVGAVCGDPILWKPSPRAALTAVAVTRICAEVMEGSGAEAVFSLAAGGADIGERMAADRRLPLISATGSCAMGRRVAPAVAGRLGRSILELGGNNAMIVMDDADLDLAVRAAVFAAVGTAGQRCTTLRRLIVHSGIAAEITGRLAEAYRSIPIGDPMQEGILMGPLISDEAVRDMMAALRTARDQGGEVLAGGQRTAVAGLADRFVTPALVRIGREAPILAEETFAPVLYVVEARSLEEAIEINNAVPQGLSSALFTDSLAGAERFLSHRGSDCGLANINIGTSGAEIGGAFGGEKDTGGGRESGSDAWKAYMRRQTCTVNWGGELPLAQGIEFG